nr:S8 family serine peptidase [Sedimentibacter acidaminivorans]
MGVDDLKFLELSGRQAFYSQGIYGQNTICAVIDTGVSPHIELENRILVGKNLNSSYSSTNNYRDDNMHGTHVAGSVAGKNVGIAPQSKILPVKVLDGSGGCNKTQDIVNGIKYARQWRSPKGEKVDVISMSLSGTKNGFGTTVWSNLQAEIKNCVKDGILVVCSAGNTGITELRYPGAYDEVVCVGAVDMEKKQADYTTMGNHVDLCQVGSNVISAYYTGGYIALSGTSMSTPIISGIACLIACQHKLKFGERITETKLYEQLKMNTKDLGIAGVDKIYGVGFCTLQPLNLTIEMEHLSNIVKFNNQNITTDIPSRVENGRFLFEMRSFAERTGADIKVEAENEYHKVKAKFIW